MTIETDIDAVRVSCVEALIPEEGGKIRKALQWFKHIIRGAL